MKVILINKNPWQTRIAVVKNNRIQDIYLDSHNNQELDNCFFKGKISKIFPGIQTAFVEIKQAKAGFLHISEVDRVFAAEKIIDNVNTDYVQDDFKNKDQIANMNMSKIFNEGEELLVQVIKEPVHEKGAKLSTCFTLPGKFLVLMPNIPQIGISKKIENKDERNRLRELLQNNLPHGMGVIIRTNAENRPEKDLKKDLAFLVSTWTSIKKKFKKAEVGECIHHDLPASLRAIRDHLDEETEFVLSDDETELKNVYKFVKYLTPEFLPKLRFYAGPPALFDKFDIDVQVEKILEKKVLLKSGGSVIIESTEAMTVVDVNTGKFTGSVSQEETVLKTNLEAAEEITTQLRLRNIGGLIVIDFIDMVNPANRIKLSRFLEKMLKEKDKYQSVTLKVSEFGLVQMTRKRTGKTLVQQLTIPCKNCCGRGFVKSIITIVFKILRECKAEILRKNLTGSIVIAVSTNVFNYIIHSQYQSILTLEKQLACKIILECDKNATDEEYSIKNA